MQIEYSNEVKGKVFAYRFHDFEKQAIARGLRAEVKKIEKRIERIENNPKNEGQATYSCQIEELEVELGHLNDIIQEFALNRNDMQTDIKQA